MFSPEKVEAIIRDVLAGNEGFLSLHEPTIAAREKELVNDCLDSGFVSSVGQYVALFEQQLADFLGVRHVVAVVNGTAALHVSLLLAGVGKSDEVIVPTLSFIATANAVSYCGAIPHFVDSNELSLGLDTAKLEGYLADILLFDAGRWINRKTGRRVAAIVPMHTFGHPVDMDALNIVAKKYCLPVVEDAAESLGSRYKGMMTGSLSLLGAISFNGNKIITTGGGGAIATNDTVLARHARHITTTAKVPHRWAFNHDAVGFNYRMPNLNAALGCAQLERMPAFLVDKRKLAERYRQAFAGEDKVRFFTEPDYAESNYWLNALLFDESVADQRDEVLSLTNDAGLMTRPVWVLLHTLPMFKTCPAMEDLSVSKSLEKRLMNIPSSPFLLRQDADA